LGPVNLIGFSEGVSIVGSRGPFERALCHGKRGARASGKGLNVLNVAMQDLTLSDFKAIYAVIICLRCGVLILWERAQHWRVELWIFMKSLRFLRQRRLY